MLSPGTIIQNYKVIAQIGSDGMGAVYKCEYLQLGSIVALKELNTQLTVDPGFVQRFRQEAQLQTKLSHANIVNLLTFFEDSGQYYMVLEYAEGKTLKDVIRSTGPIPEDRALNILKQILQALAYAHGKNIIHRDIKPSNIILHDNDEVKILDFGLARMIGEQGLAQTRRQLGTVTYMSPEQVKALKDIDGRSDIYSTGVIFFEMLSGRLPYDTNTDSDYDIMNQIVQAKLPDPRNYYPNISEHTIIVLIKMLEKDRDNRYHQCNYIIDDLIKQPALHSSVIDISIPHNVDIMPPPSSGINVCLKNENQTPQVRPWTRYWARLLDNLIWSLILGFFVGMLLPLLVDVPKIVLVIITIFLYNFVEAVMLASWGTTFGKALLKIKVRKTNGDKLSFSEALSRAFQVWVWGLGLSIPLFAIVTLYLSFRTLLKENTTIWDEDGGFIVTHHKIGMGRSLLCVFMIIVIFSVFALSIALMNKPI